MRRRTGGWRPRGSGGSSRRWREFLSSQDFFKRLLKISVFFFGGHTMRRTRGWRPRESGGSSRRWREFSVITRFFQKIIRNPCFLLWRSYNEEKDWRMEATMKQRFLQKVEGISIITRFFQKIIRNPCLLLWRSYDEEKDRRMEATRKRRFLQKVEGISVLKKAAKLQNSKVRTRGLSVPL
jgi:hypothetical protein